VDRCIRCLLLTLTLTTSLAAQQQPPPDNSAARKTAKIGGRVENAVTGEPIRRVNTVLRQFGQAGAGIGVGFAGQGAAPLSATTDAEGKFLIENVEPGSYRLMFDRQGFVRQEYGARPNYPMGTTIQLSAGQEMTSLVIKMTPQGVLSGRVLDDEDEPLQYVQVQVMRHRYIRGKRQLAPSGGGMTNDAGEFRISDLPPGRYWLVAIHARAMMTGQQPAAASAGKPAEGPVPTYYPNALDENAAQVIELTAGQQRTGLDIRLRKAPSFRARGKVALNGRSSNETRILASPRDRSTPAQMRNSSAMVRDDGTFELNGLQPGNYVVSAMAMSPSRGMTILGRTELEITHENVENLALTVVPTADLTGSIRVEGDLEKLEKEQGKKVSFSGLQLQLMTITPGSIGGAFTTSKPDGTFLIESIGADKFRLAVYNPPPGTWLKGIRAGNHDILEHGIDTTAGPPGPIEIILSTGVGQITGAVQNSRQDPAPGAIITLIPETVTEYLEEKSRTVTADQAGQFTIANLPPGDYRLYAWEDLEPGAYTDPELRKSVDGLSKKVTVKPNEAAQSTLVQISAEAAKPR